MLRCFFLLFTLIGFAQEQQFKYTNALIGSESAYLLDHAHNPINWQPWSESALKQAQEESKLVVISIGYASCHWCHVMAKESFEDEEVAAVMNADFVSIKVDREERPDIDQVYMTALQLIKGEGGWPLNVIALPDGRPLYAGTYHTKTQWLQVLGKLSELYKNQPEKAIAFADNITTGVQQATLIEAEAEPAVFTKSQMQDAVAKWKSLWDSEYGGNSGDQKFMLSASLLFLMNYAVLSKDDEALQHVELTLDALATGGIYDHVGGGFFRYSTDEKWQIPHFEKMLYDNAQLVSVYARAYRLFRKEAYKNIAIQTLQFIENELKNESGGFKSSIRADTEEGEGAYYIYTKNQLERALGSFEEAKENFELYPFNTEYYVLGFKSPPNPGLLQNQLTKLNQFRATRPKPLTDDKVITSWNALLITAFTEAYKAFQDEQYLTEAEQLFTFLASTDAQKLKHIPAAQQSGVYLEDFAYLTRAALDVYSISGKMTYAEKAQVFFDKAQDLFFDSSTGLFRYSGSNNLISSIYKTDDDVMPSPNAVMALNGFELGKISGLETYRDNAETMLQILQSKTLQYPANYTTALHLQLSYAYPYYECVVVGSDAEKRTKELWNNYLPNVLVAYSVTGKAGPLFENRYDPYETYIYVCQETFCKLPTTEVEEALKQLKN
ncbi:MULTISPECIES: thioredoxin domain-containing protein [unclassified Leeuwenhoekiella]|uniref:thioredoxin domain-containing protein n=1 Tax=unclassified Leeuwenhoekiella TaxID=2615029 RepID=UPI000C49706A|nr:MULTISPECIES: thioredoxin domain-containing protein [unclassified Leeuwenhoekiella]MAW94373.1 thioredoxin domain-containing protein [Leeuwenhoekiella sp.]MBA81050.1 thioredoxin domain-containing protein [Leeuwenhoekiella sp.]|tara:strand:+ start:21804 stop:23804 length:2001 start_codon:yes stop_codon:yes gene_type:complete